MWQLLLFLLCSSNAHYANAVILKCETPDGTVYYNDRTCAACDIETILPCQSKPLTAQEITKIEQQLRVSRNAVHKKALQRQKQKHMAAQQQQREHKARLRRKAKCETVERQIAELNQQYKDGYTVKQGKALDRKLAKYNLDRQRYCNNE